MDINHVVLVGRLTRDAEFKVIPSGQALCKFSVAINRRVKRGDNWEDEANYFDVALWGKQADAINRYLVKGKQVGVEGELRQEKWQQDGQNRSKVTVVANNVQLLGSAGGGGGGSYSEDGGGGFQPRQSTSGGGSQASSGGDAGGGEKNFDDDIPF